MIHRGYLPGCIGRITTMHAAYYGEQVGFGVQFEAKVARQGVGAGAFERGD